MNKEDLIKEMADDIHYAELQRRRCPYDGKRCFTGDCQYGNAYYICSYARMAEELIDKSYRKQREGEWIRYPHNSGIYCSLCKHKRRYRDINDPFCPNCGAKMKGANNEICKA